MATLLALPNELIEAIAEKMEKGYEPDGDMFPFRLTCRAVQLATRPLFLNKYYTTRKLVLDRTTAEKLKGYGQLPDFVEKVNTIKVFCSKIRDVDNVEESTKAVDPRFTSIYQSVSLMVAALRHFRKIKRLSFSLGYMNTSDDKGGNLADYSQIFDAVIMAAEICGHQLEEVRWLRFDSSQPEDDVWKFGTILCTNRSLSTLKYMDVDFHFPSPSYKSIEFDGRYFGSTLATALNRRESLTSLRLELGSDQSTTAMNMSQALFKTLQLPALAKITLGNFECSLHELWQLLFRHRRTIREVHLWMISLREELEQGQVEMFLTDMRNELALEALLIVFLGHGDKTLGFPASKELVDPGSYHDIDFVHVCGRIRVRKALAAMLDCFVSDARA